MTWDSLLDDEPLEPESIDSELLSTELESTSELDNSQKNKGSEKPVERELVSTRKQETTKAHTKSQQNALEDEPSEEENFIEPDEVLIVNVMAKKGELFAGEELLNALTLLRMRLGDMEIFHRHHEDDPDGPVVYSLANMIVPGTFKLSEMKTFTTPGVSMFLGLPVTGDSLSVYSDMIESAQYLTKRLGGELKDENRSVMTAQTIEHGRQRVMEYERKNVCKKSNL